MTNGVPRSINQICDSALLACMTEKQRKISRKVLKISFTVLRSDLLFTPRSRIDSSARFRKMIRRLAVFSACTMILALLGIAGYWGVLGKKAQFFMHEFYQSVLTPITPAPVVVPRPISDTAALQESPPIEMRSSWRQTTGNKDQQSGPGTALPETTQALRTDLQPRKKIVVKNGDTLHGIAYWFFPEKVDEGLKEILKLNPKIDDMNLIYVGQELIIPETDSNIKDPN